VFETRDIFLFVAKIEILCCNEARRENGVAKNAIGERRRCRSIIIFARADEPLPGQRDRGRKTRSAQGIYYGALTSSCNSLARHKVDRKYALSPMTTTVVGLIELVQLLAITEPLNRFPHDLLVSTGYSQAPP